MHQDPLPSLLDIAAKALRQNPGWLDELVGEKEAAKILNSSPATLATQRCRGGGPPFVKTGAKVNYRRRRLFERIIENERTSTSDPGPQVAA